MKTYQVLVYTALTILLSACGSGGGGSAALKVADPSANPPGGGSGAQTESLTYYTLVENLIVTHAGTNYPVTVTGHCVSYLSNDYCWDDGYQIPAGLSSSFEHSFWGLCNDNGTINMCSGGTSTDPMTTPKLYSSMVGFMTIPLHYETDVYTNGIPTNVTCTVNGSVIDCVDFQIDTSDATL